MSRVALATPNLSDDLHPGSTTSSMASMPATALTKVRILSYSLQLLTAIFLGGDNPQQGDVPYSSTPGACGTLPYSAVVSTSYGSNEADASPAYEIRQCNEYCKLGLQGFTILYSSGDVCVPCTPSPFKESDIPWAHRLVSLGTLESVLILQRVRVVIRLLACR